jgi:hypothetical protein
MRETTGNAPLCSDDLRGGEVPRNGGKVKLQERPFRIPRAHGASRRSGDAARRGEADLNRIKFRNFHCFGSTTRDLTIQ